MFGMSRNQISRIALFLVGALVGAELFYVLVANTVIFSGLIQHEANNPPENVKMDWARAY